MIRQLVARVARRLWRRLRRKPTAAAPPPPAPPEEEVEIEGEKLKGWLGQPDLVLLDVREPNELLAGYAQDAFLVPWAQVADRIGEVPPGKRIVVYCAAGSRSYGVARWLREHGRPDSFSLAGGFGEYVALGGQWLRPPPRAKFPIASRVRIGDVPGAVQAIHETADGTRYDVRVADGGILRDQAETALARPG